MDNAVHRTTLATAGLSTSIVEICLQKKRKEKKIFYLPYPQTFLIDETFLPFLTQTHWTCDRLILPTEQFEEVIKLLNSGSQYTSSLNSFS